MEIEIPSPSVFLRKSPVLPTLPAPAAVKKIVKSRNTSKSKTTTKDVAGAVVKPKQSKSRNGCMTCKKKRLKCDETKPSCGQCQKRNVSCEGYKKDFKWRSFEETNLNNKTASKKKSSNITSLDGVTKTLELPGGTSDNLKSAFASASHAFQGTAAPTIVSPSHSLEGLTIPELDPKWSPHKFDLPSPGSAFDVSTTPTQVDTTMHSPPFTGSPTLLDLLLPGTDMNQPPDLSEERPPMSPTPYQPGPYLDPYTDEEADEEILRESTQWRQSSPAPSDSSSMASRSPTLTLLSSPKFGASSPEMLALRFDQNTCGILSVKDGPSENPWRTMIWPLAKNNPALYHAISSMTAFHGLQEHPLLRMAGVAHMTKSMKLLAANIQTAETDCALATSLALALGEGWDEKTSTGVQHLRGAKFLVDCALVKYRQETQINHCMTEDAVRIRFLCNTFVYLDVIARLTSTEEAQDLDTEGILTTVNPPSSLSEVDPLMGCATTLFPIIGRVANLIQKVRKTSKNSLNIVSQANELQQQLLRWQCPSAVDFVRPEDLTSEIEHSLRTAEAYQIATLLYLHQAVPELPSDDHGEMAQSVLIRLASVPVSSRTIIVQIYPLFAASCEVTSAEDRAWATERWAAMMARLTINNVDSCWQVVQEVWQRRDAFEAAKAQRTLLFQNMPRRSVVTDIPLNYIEQEYTVRGMLHWINVMSEWQWEVFLG